MNKTLKELACYINADLIGQADSVIMGVATLQSAQQGEITFLSNPAYHRFLKHTKASAVILAPKDADDCPTNALVVNNPYLAYAKIADLFVDKHLVRAGIHPTAVIEPHCHIDKTVTIGAYVVIEEGVSIAANTIIKPGCVIGRYCCIGRDCVIEANVTLYHATQIANRVIIHSGVVLGADGFGIAEDNGKWHKVPQLGRVVIHDDVEIGAITSIDRGALDDTIIEEGVKLDNQIQIAHNVTIGAHTAIAALSGIAGSAKIGKHCRISGGVGIIGHIKLPDHTAITFGSIVTSAIKTSGIYSAGTGIMPIHEWRRNIARLRRLDEILRKLTNASECDNQPQAYRAFTTENAPVITDTLMKVGEVLKHLPQRPPFLLIDRVINFTPLEKITAIKNVTINEAYFQGHFPNRPIMPGVLILEALAQAGNLLAFLSVGDNSDKEQIYYFAGIDNARFKRPVEPGDQLILNVELVKTKRDVWKVRGVALVANEIVCYADLLSARPSGDQK